MEPRSSEFPGVLVFLTPGMPSGGNEGAIVGHVGFGVPSVQQAFAKWNAAGVKTTPIGKSVLNGQDYGHVFGPDVSELRLPRRPAFFPPIPSYLPMSRLRATSSSSTYPNRPGKNYRIGMSRCSELFQGNSVQT